MAEPQDAGVGADPGPADTWPAALWIVAGALAFASAPASFVWWKGAAYFLAGAPLMLLVTGTATARLRRTVEAMVGDVFPPDARMTGVVLILLRGLLAAIGAMLVLFAASGTLRLLG